MKIERVAALAVLSALLVGCAPTMAVDARAVDRAEPAQITKTEGDTMTGRRAGHPLIRYGLTSRSLNLGS